ncbi:DUF1257 domain-containing protein [Blastopirellula sp. JC732]|uniref:DUF1257 domain-containing protein n=1 Tax=Blastopirellula sediminis TaxID=2894196 RepID=A0A9X1SE75_9BACT|nr:DUF1257 domain-containing protein [Blastopirellula sediminis]MCC9607701.1 DUF1257 domain-containing protein [Blastopirellula sediminis]MCC9627505.1 DUF1257 domain-containing protein [Blastopirellula sediminis]
MSHIVHIHTEVRDVEAIRLATHRLKLPEPIFGEVRLYSATKTGWAVQLPDWRYPVVADVTTGRIEFDNFQGRLGKQAELDRFLQGYAVEKAKLEARKAGHAVHEQLLADGGIKLTIQAGGAQ